MAQSTFIIGRKITDPILLAHELLRGHHIESSTTKCAIKIDLKKAFDSVKWDFILSCLNLHNFPSKFISLLQACFTSPFFTIALNGEFQGFFKGRRGLRQSDPISPFLFVIVMDTLSSIINEYVKRAHTFKFHWKCGALKITHLSYANDHFLFCHGDITSVSVLKSALDHFCCMSSLDINLSKSNVYFSGTDPHTEAAITAMLGVIPLILK
ncbi:uncharacterized mitochondrial protein AtMg01250-like [Cornus florida]|uniref:uncharacterized mitochondrial protein AtMg01250-like n=1 Tax=Cornus florida TaxID=4283 RepID=UPI00289B68E0|nr:uncharacterized mitochondrial protein AtMg01250-like [Cornus florida]